MHSVRFGRTQRKMQSVKKLHKETKKTAMRIREEARTKTDLSVDIGRAKTNQKKYPTPPRSQKMRCRRKRRKQSRWKEERASIPPPPQPSFQQDLGQRNIKTHIAGAIAFRVKFNDPNECVAEWVFVWEADGKDILEDAVNASTAQNAWPVHMMRTGRYFQYTSCRWKTFRKHQKSRASKSCGLQNQAKINFATGAHGVDLFAK